MLRSTFVFLPGIGESTERRLWELGILTWDDFLTTSRIPAIPPARKASYDREVAGAVEALEAGDARYFARLLKPREHWRLFPTFRRTTAFLDIETTGRSVQEGYVTMVGICSREGLKTFVHGESLDGERLAAELASYDMLVTFYGSGFDLPFLKRQFPMITFDHPHFDLCFAARRLGYRGGLKQLERDFGLDRPHNVRGLTGWDAVELWQAWQAGHADARARLLAYNAADTQNLRVLAEHLYEQLLHRHSHKISLPGALRS